MVEGEKIVKLAVVSDTHRHHNSIKQFPPADVFIHCGDATDSGNIHEFTNFANWLSRVPYHIKLFIPGNHDWLCEKQPGMARALIREASGTYLDNEEVMINDFLFYGTPDQPMFCNWAFNKTKEEMVRSYSHIPDKTDVLVSHCCPYGILDGVMRWSMMTQQPVQEPSGSLELLERVSAIRPKLHLFGHIHEYPGQSLVAGPTTFFNASMKHNQTEPYILEI